MSITTYMRLDKYLADNGYAGNAARARGLIESGQVMVNGQIITKASFPMHESFKLQMLIQDHAWVSQSGPKFDFALSTFGINPGGRIAIDIGAGLGGFTDVLLTKNAKHVYCVDVLIGMLHEKIKTDERVTVLDHIDVRNLKPEMIAEPYDLLVCDLSDISLTTALPRAMDMAPEKAELLAVIKPQFEIDSPESINEGGYITDPVLQKQACEAVERWLRDDMKWIIKGFTPDPAVRNDGNRDFFVHAIKP